MTFTLSEQDIFRFMLYHSLHEQRFLTWGAYLAAIGWTIYGTATAAPGAPAFFPILAGAFMAIFLVPFHNWLLRWRARRWLRDNPSVAGETKHELSPEGVLESSTAWGEATLKWSTYTRIVATSEYIYLYRGRNITEVIPRRAFDSPEAAEAFLQAAKTWHAAATAAPTE